MRDILYDFEFSEDGRTIIPISLGMVEGRRELYIEFEFDEQHVRATNPWVTANVLPMLNPDTSTRLNHHAACDKILAFVGNPRMENAFLFWAYYAGYDTVVLSQLFGGMTKWPQHFPMFTMDLQQYFVMLGSPAAVKPEQPVRQHNSIVDARWNQKFLFALREHERLRRSPA